MVNRRKFITGTSLITLGGVLAGSASLLGHPLNVTDKSNRDSRKRIGLQTYSLGREFQENIPGGLQRVKKMGYSYLELAGYRDRKLYNIEISRFRKMAEDAGLDVISSHLNPPVREYTDSSTKTVLDFYKKASEDHAALGVSYMIQPGLPLTRSTEEVSKVCDVFNQVGEVVKSHKIHFGYHNHYMEFARVVPGGKKQFFGLHALGREIPPGTEVIYDGFLKQTDPDLVLFEMDAYWTVMGQNDPVEYLKKYSERIKLLHIKDRGVLGQSGMMNFENIFNMIYENDIKHYFVELEKVDSGTQFEATKACIEYLNKAPFVK